MSAGTEKRSGVEKSDGAEKRAGAKKSDGAEKRAAAERHVAAENGGVAEKRAGVRGRSLKLVLGFMALLAAAMPETAARADDPPKQEELPRRQANYVWDKNEKTGQVLLKAGFSYRDVVDKTISDKLSSGIPQTMLMRAYVLREGDNHPIALAGRTCTIKYDLWDEIYRVKIGAAEHDTGVINIEGVLRQCAQVQDLVVADKVLLTGNKPFFLGVIVEVNPISPQMLAQMKQWVSRPAGSTGIGPGDALFGSFVGLFVRQIGTADKTLRFRTQSVVPPP